jgi:ATP-dependent DNA helicase RecG
MAELRADSPIQYLKGVGPARCEAFAALGIKTVADLLEHFPFRYDVALGEVEIADLHPGEIATIRGEVRRVRGRWPMFAAELEDGSGRCWLRWFDQRYGGHGLYVGAIVVATGKVQEYQDRLEIVHPRTRVFAPDTALPPRAAARQLVPVYPATEELKSGQIARVMQALLATLPQLPVEEALPAALRIRHSLPTRAAAVRDIHQPRDEAAADRARRRLAYEELFLLELGIALRRQRLLATSQAVRLTRTDEIDRRIRARFPFALTPAQDRVIEEISRDLAAGRPMTRLLQGDVGSGKTVVALYACLLAIAHGRQAAIMAPTEVLAQQHFGNIERYLAGSRVRRLLLRGGLGRSERAAGLGAIAAGDVDLVVGTHALVQEDVAFRDLALVVVDEQHKFGVVQRANIRTKGPLPHYLVMTATPIPRTLAMTVFGDLDVSVIDGSPPGRGRVETKIVSGRDWDRLMAELRPRLDAGEQAYVVCPTIGAEAEEDGAPTAKALASVRATLKRLADGAWAGLPLGLLHGGLPAAEKQAALQAFARGDWRALVATTVVEVGVDVPTATLMIVDHAERFGLSQLHQLRGRIGRGSRDGLCVLVAHGRGDKARERLAVIASTTDGFRIAEADLKQRGPGELLGTRQHGLPELRVASLVDDFALLEQARQDAFALAAADPHLADPAHRKLLPALRRMFKGRLRLIDAA